MATNQSSPEQITVIRIDIDGEKHRLPISYSSNAEELRIILSKRYGISSNTHFVDCEGYSIFPEDEQSIPISDLLTKDNIIKLKTDKSQSTPVSIGQKSDLKYVHPSLSQSTRTALREIKLPGSSPTRSENPIILATDLDRDMWEKLFLNCNLFRGIRMDKETPTRAFRSMLKFKGSNNDLTLFQVTDDSYIRAYMKDKEMHSSFLSSRFFDGGIEFSSSLIGIGINAVYSKSKGATNTQRKIYLTYCFNFPRVTLELDLSYLEPTFEFIEAIDNVLSTLSRDEQIIKLEEVLSIYGHVYPRLVILGGQLYHTEIHQNKEKAQEAEKRISGETSFSIVAIQPVKAHAASGSEKKSQEKSYEQTSLLTFTAVGGDTRCNRDPALWTNTIADPSLWRIIEQDNYQSVITLLDRERQEKVQEILSYYNQKMIQKMNTRWKQTGLTIAGGIGKGNKLNQFFHPEGIFIHDDQTIYIADYFNHRIVEWESNAKYGRIVAGGNGKGDKTDQLNCPTDVIVDKENDCLYISDYGNRRVMQWSRQNNTKGQVIISNIRCHSLTMNKDGSLYVSDSETNEVRRWNKGDKNGTLVAGGNEKGNQLNQLSHPTYIFVDNDYSLYISDSQNRRVMKWIIDAKEGIVVAGGNGEGNSLTQLSYPQGVIVDQLGQIYVTDYDNHRVMRWCSGAKEGTIVVGGNGEGEQSNQLFRPRGLSFDRHGSLYVGDCFNHRIQKFEVDENENN